MTVHPLLPQHTIISEALAGLLAARPEVAAWVDSTPAAAACAPAQFAARIREVWNLLAEVAPVGSTLARSSTEPMADYLDVTIETPDPASPVLLLRSLPDEGITTDRRATGRAAVAATVPVLAGALTALQHTWEALAPDPIPISVPGPDLPVLATQQGATR